MKRHRYVRKEERVSRSVYLFSILILLDFLADYYFSLFLPLIPYIRRRNRACLVSLSSSRKEKEKINDPMMMTHDDDLFSLSLL